MATVGAEGNVADCGSRPRKAVARAWMARDLMVVGMAGLSWLTPGHRRVVMVVVPTIPDRLLPRETIGQATVVERRMVRRIISMVTGEEGAEARIMLVVPGMAATSIRMKRWMAAASQGTPMDRQVAVVAVATIPDRLLPRETIGRATIM